MKASKKRKIVCEGAAGIALAVLLVAGLVQSTAAEQCPSGECSTR